MVIVYPASSPMSIYNAGLHLSRLWVFHREFPFFYTYATLKGCFTTGYHPVNHTPGGWVSLEHRPHRTIASRSEVSARAVLKALLIAIGVAYNATSSST
jgi:hypothetical protein